MAWQSCNQDALGSLIELTHKWFFIRKNGGKLIVKPVSLSSDAAIKSCWRYFSKVFLDNLFEIFRLEHYFHLLDVKHWPEIFNLISDCKQQLLVDSAFHQKLLYFHFLKPFFLGLHYFKHAAENIVLILVVFGCFSPERLTFAGLSFPCLYELVFSENLEAGFKVTTFPPNSIGFDVSHWLKFLLALSEGSFIMQDNQSNTEEIGNSLLLLPSQGFIIENVKNYLCLDGVYSFFGSFDYLLVQNVDYFTFFLHQSEVFHQFQTIFNPTILEFQLIAHSKVWHFENVLRKFTSGVSIVVIISNLWWETGISSYPGCSDHCHSPSLFLTWASWSTLHVGSKGIVEEEFFLSLEVKCIEKEVIIVVPVVKLISIVNKKNCVFTSDLRLMWLGDKGDNFFQMMFW